MNSLKAIISHIPHSPGIYQFLNEKGEPIYVGKAVDLRKRVSSYFRKQKNASVRLQKLVLNTVDIQYTTTDSEMEALILETNLIKSYRPRYNVLMKDDKNYVYVKVTRDELYPRVYVTRFLKRDGACYFGPKTSASGVNRILKALKKISPYRHCDLFIDLRGKDFKQKRDDVFGAQHKKRCLGPCVLSGSREEYQGIMEQIVAFFEGKTEPILAQLRVEMKEAVTAREFEKAAQIRDRLKTIEDLMSIQRVSAPDHANRDVIGLVLQSGAAYVILFEFREGKLNSQENFILNAASLGSDGFEGAELENFEVLTSFLNQYYEKAASFPREILISEVLPEMEVLKEWISMLAGHPVKLISAKQGKNRKLLNLAHDNALSFAKQSQVKWQAGSGQNVDEALEGLKSHLNLPRIPKRIECYDISHLGGTDTVGSMVVFEKGFPKKSDYRYFKLRTVQGEIDDYKAMEEVLTRRLCYLKKMPDYFRKPRKKELEEIQKILEREQLDSMDLDQHKMLIFEKKKKIMGVARLKPLEKDVTELASLWVDPKFRGQGFGQEIVLALLAKQKKGKVYVVCSSKMLDLYGALGFHEVQDYPSALKEKLTHGVGSCCIDPIVMVYRFFQGDEDVSFKRKPDLLIIDGGKGQLKVVSRALKVAHLKIPVISLAKRQEEIFIPSKSSSLILPRDSDALQLVQRLRDEAHRFALKYQRNLRGKRMLS